MFKPVIEDGIRSNKLTDTITPEAKASEQAIILSLLLYLKNNINEPKTVEIPARKLIKNANFI